MVLFVFHNHGDGLYFNREDEFAYSVCRATGTRWTYDPYKKMCCIEYDSLITLLDFLSRDNLIIEIKRGDMPYVRRR